MPSSPRGVRLLSGQRKRTRPYRWHPGRCGHRAPTKNNVRFQRRGRCPHRPAGAVPERPERTNVPLPTSFRSNESIGLLRNKRILNVGGDAHIAPRVRYQSGPKERTCPFQRPCGSMKACAPTICNLEFPFIVIYTIAYFSFSLFTNRGNCCKIE